MDLFSELTRHVTLSNVASVITIIGFIFTVIMFFDIKSIKRYYFLAGRLPEVTEKLRTHASNMNEYIDNFDLSIKEISLEIARLDVVLSSLGNKLDRQSAKSVVQLQEKIRHYKPKKEGQERLFEIYVDLHTILEELDELQRDAKWER